MKIVGVVQARMGSTRLPGKVLAEIGGRPLLLWQLLRLQRALSLDSLIVATTDRVEDDPVAALWESIRGSSADVLSRFVQADGDIIVRLTGDSPLLDPELVDQVVGYFTDHYPRYDYVSTGLDRSFPRGMDVEVMTAEALRRSDAEATDAYDREHVTSYIYRHPEKFSLGDFNYRLTVDTTEDFSQMQALIEELGEGALMATYPEIIEHIYRRQSCQLH